MIALPKIKNYLRELTQSRVRVFFLLAAVILIAYGNLPNVFFQQDEWYGFGTNLYARSLKPLEWLRYWLTMPGYPFNYMLQDINMSLFKLNAKWWAYESMLLHLAVSFLFYLVASRLTRNRFIVLMSCLIYATTPVHYQAVVWIVQSLNKQLPALFGLLSFYFFLGFMEKGRFRQMLLAILFLLIGLTHRDTILFLFLFMPVLYLFRGPVSGKLKDLKPALILLSVFLVYTAIKFYSVTAFPPSQTAANSLAYPSVKEFMLRILTLPVRIVPQVFFTQGEILKIAKIYTAIFHPALAVQKGTTHYDVLIEGMISRQVICGLSFLVLLSLGIIIYALLKKRRSDLAGNMVFSVVFIMLSAVPYAIIPGQAGFREFLESRYLYISTMGMAWLSATLLAAAFEAFPSKFFRWGGLKVSLVLLLLAVNLLHTGFIVSAQVNRSRAEKHILNTVMEKRPQISDRSIFYIASNRPYHGQIEPILPFQCGAGQVLLVSYVYRGFLGPEFFKGDMPFYHLLFQGIEKHGGRGFGYYRDYGKIIDDIQNGRLNGYAIYSFRWDAMRQVIEPTEEELENDNQIICVSLADCSLLEEEVCLREAAAQGIKNDIIEDQDRRFPALAAIDYPAGWFLSDYTRKEDYRSIKDTASIEGNRDYFRTYNYGLDYYYGGPFLVHFAKGNGAKEHQIPPRLHGYKIIGISSARTMKKNLRPQEIIPLNNGGWRIIFPYAVESDDYISFLLALEGKVVYYLPRRGIEDIVHGYTEEIEGDGVRDTFFINAKGQVRAVNGYYVRDEIGYRPFGYGQGCGYPIKDIKGFNTPRLSIVFERPPGAGELVRIPLLVSYKPEEKVMILRVLFSEMEK